MDNIINLEFEKTITNLAGNRMGNQVYKEKIASKINTNINNIVIFPAVIEDIASSFIEGIYKELGEQYGKKEAVNIMTLKAENVEADNKIKESIETFGV